MSCSCRWKLGFNVGFHNLCAKCIVFCCCCKYRKSGSNQTRINYGICYIPTTGAISLELARTFPGDGECVWGGYHLLPDDEKAPL